MNRTSRSNVVIVAAAGALLSLGALAGCSGSDGGGGGDTDEPAPVGGINGPARVDTDLGGATNNEPED